MAQRLAWRKMARPVAEERWAPAAYRVLQLGQVAWRRSYQPIKLSVVLVGKRCENYSRFTPCLPIHCMRVDLNEHSHFQRAQQLCLLAAVGLFVVAAGLTHYLLQQYQDTIYPNVSIDQVTVSGMTRAEARQALLQREKTLPSFSLTLAVDDITVASAAAELGGSYNYDLALDRAFEVGRQQPWWQRVWRVATPWSAPVSLETQYQLDQSLVAQQVEALAAKVDIPAEQPAAALKYSGVASSLKIIPGRSGRFVDQKETIAKVLERIQHTDVYVPAVVASESAGLQPDELEPAVTRAKAYVGKKIILRADNVFREMNDQLLINLLAFPSGLSTPRLQPVLDQLAKDVNRPPQDAVFTYDPETLVVNRFEPGRPGLDLDREAFTTQLSQTMASLATDERKTAELALAVKETAPTTALADTNSLGIKERIGFGESQYAHSIPNRVHNVSLTTQRITNRIIRPGEEFSFNKTLGEVSAATGFKSAYIIQGGRTVLGDGGGVCQVSTTLFRAVLNAGLPITKRRPHSYRVSYYEQNAKPGLDATVYSGDVDLRFVNDTGHAVLIHAKADSKRTYMFIELYGTSDGRTTEIVDHKTWDARPAPPPLYIDDATIPKGQVRQVDFAASGIRASFRNLVRDKDGQLIRDDTYTSNYVPWRAVYLRGI